MSKGRVHQVVQNARDFAFYSDESSFFEGFEDKSNALVDSVKTSGSQAITARHKALGEFASDAAMKAALDDRFEVQTPLILAFTGHGLENYWGDSQMFKATDAKDLRNDVLPIVFGLNCLSGSFADNDVDNKSMGEALVGNPDGGAVAYWGSTTYSLPEAQVNLNKAFFQELSQKMSDEYSEVRMGDLILLAKSSQGSKTSASDVLKSWTLLGDPALKIPRSSFAVAEKTIVVDAPATAPSDDGGGGGGCGLVAPPPGSGVPIPPWSLFILLMPFAMLVYLRGRLKNKNF